MPSQRCLHSLSVVVPSKPSTKILNDGPLGKLSTHTSVLAHFASPRTSSFLSHLVVESVVPCLVVLPVSSAIVGRHPIARTGLTSPSSPPTVTPTAYHASTTHHSFALPAVFIASFVSSPSTDRLRVIASQATTFRRIVLCASSSPPALFFGHVPLLTDSPVSTYDSCYLPRVYLVFPPLTLILTLTFRTKYSNRLGPGNPHEAKCFEAFSLGGTTPRHRHRRVPGPNNANAARRLHGTDVVPGPHDTGTAPLPHGTDDTDAAPRLHDTNVMPGPHDIGAAPRPHSTDDTNAARCLHDTDVVPGPMTQALRRSLTAPTTPSPHCDSTTPARAPTTPTWRHNTDAAPQRHDTNATPHPQRYRLSLR
ncbi:hypothetical protein H4582DRAFT_2070200 [Lactarius indigo]|nr:hypothetical protein H4582DRAFT_2070200 [Lactarius indigo]